MGDNFHGSGDYKVPARFRLESPCSRADRSAFLGQALVAYLGISKWGHHVQGGVLHRYYSSAFRGHSIRPLPFPLDYRAQGGFLAALYIARRDSRRWAAQAW